MFCKTLVALMAVGALGVSSAALAAGHGHGGSGHGSMGMSHGSMGMSHSMGMRSGAAMGTVGRMTGPMAKGPVAGPKWSGNRQWSGKNVAFNKNFRDHRFNRFHNRNAFFFGAGVGFAGPWWGDYGYDSCWVWTPWGLQWACGGYGGYGWGY
jgi:hypothetical protein